MDITLTSDDVFEIAERIERNGGRFYIEAAELHALSALARVFRRLAEMEIEHEQTFARLRLRFAEGEGSALPLPPDSETTRYLMSLTKDKFFARDADPTAFLTDTVTPRDVLLTAIGMENETIRFYEGLRAVVAAVTETTALDRIIEEEHSHVGTLAAQLAGLEGGGEEERACSRGP